MGIRPSRSGRVVRGAVALTVGAAVWGVPGLGHAAVPRKWHPPAVQRVRVLPRVALRLPAHQGRLVPRVPEGMRPGRSWPAGGAAVVGFAGLRRGQLARAAGLPVLAGAAGGGLAGVRVDLLGHPAAARLGLAGLVLTVSASGPGYGLASVAVDYSGFANAVGGDFGTRLHLVELPGCALTTPGRAACRVESPVDSANNGRVVSGAVRLGGAGLAPAGGAGPHLVAPSASSLVVLAAVSGSSGSNGDFTVSSLSPQGTWTGGGPSGDFSWTYPFKVPPPPAGPAPAVSLAYSSSSSDGRVASTNNQFGMVGEGFTLSSDSYVERTYTDCADDPEGAISGKYDQCWAGQVVTMSLNGRSTPLVLDDSTGKWHESIDSGDRVQYLTGTAADTGNGTHDNGYWVVTTPDGTQYFFGKNKGPGWASGDGQTNSAATVRVYGPHSGDPCYSSSGFSSSYCTQAWRWNLDFVIDPNGNAMAYYYTQESNYYGADGGTTGVQYVRNEYLSHIDYGLRYENGTLYGTVNANAPEQVVFGTDQRCIPTSSFSCDASQFNATNASYWPDTPEDQMCTASQSCDNHSPTFWSQLRIDSITTKYYNGSGYTKVDSWSLGQGFPTSGDPELVLNSITRTGYAASGSSLALPSVLLSYQLMNNRIPGYNNEPSMSHWRLTGIEDETGQVIAMTYSTGCTTAQIPADPSQNSSLCFPVMWAPAGGTNETLDYFDKYVVTQVLVQDGTAGDPAHLTTYDYIGNPGWHYDDNEVVKAKDRTWGQFRGYAQVDTLTGDPSNLTNGTADVQAEVDTRYFQGMNGDTLPNGGTRTGITVKDSSGVRYPDDNALAGQVLETQALNGSGGAELSANITVPSVVQVTGSRSRTGLPALQATMVRPITDTTYTDLASGGTQQVATTTQYDSHGRAILADQTGTSVPETCTQTSYDDNSTAWIYDASSEVITAQQACPTAPGTVTASDILTDSRTYYDGATSLTTPPTAGNPTKTTAATANSAGTLTFATQSTTTYDGLGRVATRADGAGNTTSTTYTPADGGPVTQVQESNALAQVTTRVLDPGRGMAISSTDAAGYLTTATYDPLGRLTALWKPGRSQSGGALANVTYSYQVSQSAPMAVTTNTLVDYGTGTNYVTSISIYDSLGQLRQTQTAAEGGNTAVTDNFYDSHGWIWQTSNKYVISGQPTTTIASVADSAVNDRTVASFDGSGRVVSQQDFNGLTLTDSMQTVYSGNQVTVISRDPAGNVVGTPQATVSDALGQKIQTVQYASAPTVTGSVISGGSPKVTATTFDASGNQAQVTDPAGHTWTYSYDLLGRQIQAVDPDTGTTSTGYDAAGNVAWTTDGRSNSVNYVYDKLNRKTAEYTGSTTQGSGTKIATWVWDTLKKGLPSYQTSISGGVTYQNGNLGYDAYGNATGTWVTVPTGQPLAGTYRTTTTFSSTGQMLGMTPASGGGLPVDSITYTYDKYGNSVTEAGNNVYASGAVWTPYNEISQIELGSGPSAAALTYSYDPQTRDVTGINLSDQQASPQADNIAYTYNSGQQITQIADTQGASGSPVEDQCFTYDSLSRLSQAWTSSNACGSNPATAGNGTVKGPEPYWQSWTFDSVGDLATRTDHAPAGSSAGDTTTTYHYGVTGHAHAVSSITATNTVTGTLPTVSYGYDGSGNTTTFGSQALTWDPNGKLATAGTTSAPVSYRYDANGNELTEAETSGTTTTTTLYLPGEQLTTNGSTTTGVRYYTFAGHVIAQTTPTTLYWLSGSTQGTMTTAVAAFAQGTVIRRAATPYGTTLSGTGTWPDNRGFLGDAYHSATTLTDIGARKYNAATGLFISADPILDTGTPQSMTGYTYSAADPVNNADPTGQMFIADYGGGGGYVPVIPPPVMHYYYYYAPPAPVRPARPPFWNMFLHKILLNDPLPIKTDRPFCGDNAGTGEHVCSGLNTTAYYGGGTQAGFDSAGRVQTAYIDKLKQLSNAAKATQDEAFSNAGRTLSSTTATSAEKSAAARMLRSGRGGRPITPQQAALTSAEEDTGLLAKLGKLTESTGWKAAGWAGIAVGSVMSGVSAYDAQRDAGASKLKAGIVGATTTVADAGIGWGAAWAGAELGAAVGTAIPIPVVGTVGGAIVGGLVGAGIAFFGSNEVNNLISDVASWF